MSENIIEVEEFEPAPKRALVKKALVIGAAVVGAIAASAVVVSKIKARTNNASFGYADGDVTLSVDSTESTD